MRKLCLLFALSVTLAMAAKLEFEVASIRPASGGAGPVGPAAGGEARRGGMFVQLGTANGRFVAQGLPLRVLILLAYDLQDFELSGGPDDLMRSRYDIQAKAEDGLKPTREQVLEMLQSLLEDRFALKLKREIKKGQTYELVAVKGAAKPGLKLSADQSPIEKDDTLDPRELRNLIRPGGPGEGRGGRGGFALPGAAGGAGAGSSAGPTAGGGAGPTAAGAGPGGGGGRGAQKGGGQNRKGGEGGPDGPGGPLARRGQPLSEMKRGDLFEAPGLIRGKAVAIEDILGLMEGELRKPIANKTGLKGLYDIEMNWMPAELASLVANLPADRPLPRGLDATGPPLPKALQDQLGLKLETASGDIPAVAIESVKKPSEN